MANNVSLYIILLTICYISSIKSDNKETQTTKEWIFQFDLKNAKHWDNYEVNSDESSSTELIGSSNGCTSRLPIIFKKLCVNWNNNNGYTLQFKSSNNINIDPNYGDMLWYYGDHNTAKKAEQVAKAKYIDLENKQLTEISHNINLRRRLKTLGTKKCYWYNDAKACAHLDESNQNLMTVSVGLNENNAAQYSDYDNEYEYYDDDNDDDNEEEYEYEYDDDNDEYDEEEYYDDDDNEEYIDDEDEDDAYVNADEYDGDEYYNEYDLNEIYNEYIQEQLFYNQYMQQLNNLYWQNYLQQQASGQQEYYNNYYEGYDSDDKETSNDDNDNGIGISENSIMQKAEAEARINVEKKMEKKLEGKLEAEMMQKLDHGLDGMMHKKHKNGGFGGGDIDAEHGGPPDEEDGNFEMDDQNNNSPHDSLSAE